MDKDGKIIGLIAWLLICYGVYGLGRISLEVEIMANKDINIQGLVFKCDNYYPKK